MIAHTLNATHVQCAHAKQLVKICVFFVETKPIVHPLKITLFSRRVVDWIVPKVLIRSTLGSCNPPSL